MNHSSFRQSNIVKDIKVRYKSMIMRNCKRRGSISRIILATIFLLVLSILFASCSSSDNMSPMDKGGYGTEPSVSTNENWDAQASPQESGSGMGDGNYAEDAKNQSNIEDIMSQRKIIMDGDVSLETMHFDDSIAAMDQLINDFGGFAEVRNVVGKSQYSQNRRNATYVLRVPADRFELVLKNMGNIGTVLESNSKGTDITDQYYDTEARIKTLKVQEETLLGILTKSTNLDDVITLESRISQVRYEIESLENTVRNYDRLLSFSRITVYIREVDDRSETKPTPETLGDRISTSFNGAIEDFKRGFEDFIVWLAGSWITIIWYIIIISIAVICYRIIKRRRTKKKLQAGVAVPKYQANAESFKTKESEETSKAPNEKKEDK